MSGAARLYTPELLALAVELARYPLLEQAQFTGDARSPACGSTLMVQIDCDGEGRIARLGLRVRACAVGQAAAAIFARHAPGCTVAQIGETLVRLERWLAEPDAAMPEWPDLHLIEPARSYPGRHGAMLLPWRAAVAALSNAPVAR